MVGLEYTSTFTFPLAILISKNSERLIKKHLLLLHSDANLKTLFRTEICNVVYSRNKNLTELLKPFNSQKKKIAVALLVVIRAIYVKTTWSLAVHLFVLLLLRNIALETILHVVLLISFIW